ncbi:MAG: 3'(2'),5'-bisphosphate nucleotidase CysQ [Flavobacteriales bacterium]|nr:3'(2'),5'-bisphosphate nucleotidase CysQ [Flavobacteriales bacterium]
MAEAPLPDSPLDLQSALDHALSVVRTAAAELARLSHTALEVQYKGDGSPVTNADHASHEIISAGLAPLGIPVISEEGGRTPHAERKQWSRMWLVDPLDGTGSFIRMRSGYAINVALLESDGHEWLPVLGIVALPDLDRVYFGGRELGTWKGHIDDAARPAKPIRSDDDASPPYDLLISWNEGGTLNDLVAGTVDPTEVRMRPASGAHKFCLVAEGKADIHARSTGYFEWDCAAGDALLRAQGLSVRDIVTGRPLTYNGPHLRVGGLIASRLPENS